MRKLALIVIIYAALSAAAATPYFKVIDAPDAIVQPNTTITLPITIQNIGGDGAYARLVFRGLPPGISVSNVTRARWVYPGGRMTFNVNLSAGEIPPANHTIEVGVAAKGSPPNYRSFHLIVENVSEEGEIAKEEMAGEHPEIKNVSDGAERQIPAAGALWSLLAVAAATMVSRRER
ncbi:MAG: hypothetical protein NQU42_04590 [Methanothrix sp.]|uniref:hypothetical protein n=1 Tax=Methanothrix sp. TaxID=90426 RepID=UPI0025DDEF96|nr:hypothetical protein [Methanothrix sp.]MCQ8903352.1 hypothetical protein [Methanothrix sp.]